MSNKEKTISFLNNYYIFKKIRNPNAKEITDRILNITEEQTKLNDDETTDLQQKVKPKKKRIVKKYKKLPNHVERSFFEALKRSAIEHRYNGFLYRFRFLVRRLFNHILQTISKIVPFSGFRVILQKLRGVKIGKSTHIGPLVTIDDVYPEYVIIEDGVSVAGLNFILTHSKPLDYHSALSPAYLSPVRIKKNAWIAIGVIILPGVTIGEGSIVASGSVVTKDIPPGVFAGGIPAKVIKEYDMDGNIPKGYKKR